MRYIALALSLLLPLPAAADPGVAAALREIGARNWTAAMGHADRAADRAIARDLVEWHRLRTGDGTLADYTAFLSRRADWPGMGFLRVRGEAALQDAPADAVVAYFANQRPATGAGAIALVRAHRARGEAEAARTEARRVWREMTLSAEDEAALLALHLDDLRPLHDERLDRMLWRGSLDDAERMLPRVSAEARALATARIALQARRPGVDTLIGAVPAGLSDHPGLAWDRFAWRMVGSLYDSAGEFLVERSTSAAALGDPEVWAPRRALLARRALREGDPHLAYRLAANHHLTGGANYADLEWLAGFIALTRLDDPATALRHFRALRAAVSAPISLGRAGYWEGRAHEALGEAEAARAAFAYGAEHQTSFYGLLAAERAGIPMDAGLVGSDAKTDWRGTSFANSSVLAAAKLIQDAGDPVLARRFLYHLAEGVPDHELAAIADLGLDWGEANTALTIAKLAASRGIILPRAYFPVTELASMDLPVDAALALAIARRESEFDPAAISPAGARGLMQVMPGTAEMVSRRLGEEYQLARLTGDPRFNARLGAAYLAELREEFGASTILVAAGYNAGPGRPREWVRTLGDPRAPGVDPVEWIEMVPFTETRNYIMRVMEALWIYRARLSGAPIPLTLTDELKAR